jgi:hypothetical protein
MQNGESIASSSFFHFSPGRVLWQRKNVRLKKKQKVKNILQNKKVSLLLYGG